MTVSCPDCRSVFRVDPAKVPATGVRARCSVCGGIIAIAAGTLPVSVTPASLGAVAARSTPLTPQRPYSPQALRPATPTSLTTVPDPASTPVPSPTPATLTPRRSINPFLNADPGQRARRLARALVSDLVAYHPQKREEGLREGTLKQLFREDIKKSYEEYVEQVGRDVAEGSPHFQEALNEILGGGHRLFS